MSPAPPASGQPRARALGGPEWVLLAILSIVWGGSFLFFKILVRDLPPFTIVLGRVGMAGAVLHLVLLARGAPLRIPRAKWSQFLLLGLLNNVMPFALIAFGEARISSGAASILNAMTPVFTILVAHVSTVDEKLTWAKSLGVLLGLIGVAVLIGPASLGRADAEGLVGDAACLLAALVYGFGGIYSRRFRGMKPLDVATAQLTASTILALPLSLLIDRPWQLPMPDGGTWAAWVGLAIPSTALAYLMFFRILATAGATSATLVTLLIPVSSLWLGALFLGEPVTMAEVAGMMLIGCGLAAIDRRPVAWLWRRPAAAR